MRSAILASAFQLASCLALPVPHMPALPPREIAQQQRPASGVLEYSYEKAYVEFAVPCAGCPRADESLVFRFQPLAAPANNAVDFKLNDYHFTHARDNDSPSLSQAIPVYDVSGHLHTVTLYWSLGAWPSLSALVDPNVDTTFLHFTVHSVDAIADVTMAFTIGMDIDPYTPRLTRLLLHSTPDIVRFSQSEDTFDIMDGVAPPNTDQFNGNNTLNIESELEYLRHLEAQATELRFQISAKKAAITAKLRQNRDKVCLKELIKDCDGVVCAARVIAQRVCDKVGINVDPAFGFPTERLPPQQRFMAASKQPFFTNEIDNTTYTTQGLHLPLLLTKDGDSVPHPLIYILQVLAGALGLTSLWLLIKRKCISARTKVERAADREERRNRRAYRRAARRALMRKRWDDLLGAVNCFRVRAEPRLEDCEEKRALILQDAFLQQDLEQAEKGDVMEAEIRELRHAHEIVSGLIRVEGHGYDDRVGPPRHDPPPPFVPLPHTPVVRSRASTHTLPSYTSEVLPDYASRYSRERRRLSGSTVNYTPSTSSGEDGHTADVEGLLPPGPSSRSDNSGSSVLAMSRRPSAETLWTGRPSGETMDR